MWKKMDEGDTYVFSVDDGLVAEYDADGTELVSYGYRPDSTWTTDPLWQKRGEEYYFYQNDHLGTPQKLVKSNGAVVWSAGYTAFGQATVEIQDVPNNLRFPGQYADAETGLHYNFHRYYAPGMGRYLRVDPLGLKAGVNLFVYVQNNPLMNKDFLGLYVDCNGLGGSGAAGTPIPKIAGAGSGAILKCQDDSGNYGVFLCFGLGLGVGTGFTAGAQWTRVYVQTLCELNSCGISPSGGVGVGYGPGMGIDISAGSDTIIIGGGIGGFGSSGSFFSCCITIFARNKCGFPICEPKNPMPDNVSPADVFWHNYYANQPR